MSYEIQGIPGCITDSGRHDWQRWSATYRAAIEVRWYGNVTAGFQANQCTVCDLRITRRV